MKVSIDRKLLFRVLSSLLVVSIFSILVFGNQAFAYDEPVNHTEESDSTYYGYVEGTVDIYAATR